MRALSLSLLFFLHVHAPLRLALPLASFPARASPPPHRADRAATLCCAALRLRPSAPLQLTPGQRPQYLLDAQDASAAAAQATSAQAAQATTAQAAAAQAAGAAAAAAAAPPPFVPPPPAPTPPPDLAPAIAAQPQPPASAARRGASGAKR